MFSTTTESFYNLTVPDLKEMTTKLDGHSNTRYWIMVALLKLQRTGMLCMLTTEEIEKIPKYAYDSDTIQPLTVDQMLQTLQLESTIKTLLEKGPPALMTRPNEEPQTEPITESEESEHAEKPPTESEDKDASAPPETPAKKLIFNAKMYVDIHQHYTNRQWKHMAKCALIVLDFLLDSMTPNVRQTVTNELRHLTNSYSVTMPLPVRPDLIWKIVHDMYVIEDSANTQA
jgi:hypothetical protein